MATSDFYVYCNGGVLGEIELLVRATYEQPHAGSREEPASGGWIVEEVLLDLKSGKHLDITDLYGEPGYRAMTDAVDEELRGEA